MVNRVYKKYTLEIVQELSNTVHNNNFIVILDQIYVNSKNKLKFYCKTCENIIEQRVDNHLNGAKCPVCSNKNSFLTIEQIKEKVKEIFGNKFTIPDQEIKGVKYKIKVYCNIFQDYFEVRLNTLLSGSGCSKCKYNKIRLTLEEVRLRSKNIHGEKYYIPDQEIKNNDSKIKIYCNNCGEYFDILTHSHFKGDGGCNKCAIKKRTINMNKIIDVSKKIHGNFYVIDKNQKIKNSTSIIKIYCEKCNEFFSQRISDHLYGCGCPNCKISHGEKIIKNYLIEKNINYEQQKKFKNCRNKLPLPFDFYLPEKNLCIEFDGEQHFKQIHNWDLKKTIEHDIIKNNYCKANNIKLLRIKFDENVLEKLEKVK